MSATHATVPVHPATADTTAASATRAPPRANKLADFRVAVRAEDPSRPVDSDVAAAVDALTVQRAAGAKVAVQPTSLPVDTATNHQPAFPPLVHGPFSHDRIAPAAVSHTTLLARLFRQFSSATQTLRGTFQPHHRRGGCATSLLEAGQVERRRHCLRRSGDGHPGAQRQERTARRSAGHEPERE